MTVIDFNGTGIWSAEQILSRYNEYVKKYSIQSPRDLSPREHCEGNKRWIYPVMDQVIQGIEAADLACAEIGIEFIEENQSFTFGAILKSNTARALRRTYLTEEQKDRIRRRIAAMLIAGYLPREFRQYAKLGRKIGLGELLNQIRAQVPLEKPWVQRYYEYLEQPPAH